MSLLPNNAVMQTYQYIPHGQHVIRALGVCGGRPTFKCAYPKDDFDMAPAKHLALDVNIKRCYTRASCSTNQTIMHNLSRKFDKQSKKLDVRSG